MLRQASIRRIRPSTNFVAPPLYLVRPSVLASSTPSIRQCLRLSSSRAAASSSSTGAVDKERNYSTATTTAEASIPDAGFEATVHYNNIFKGKGDVQESSFEYTFPALQTPDPSSIVMFQTPEAGGDKVAGFETLSALRATFEACIRVDRLARAQILLIQLSGELSNTDASLLRAHNLFLEALIKRLSSQKDSTDMSMVFSWYDSKMKDKYNIQGNPLTFSLLLKAASRISDDEKAKQAAIYYLKEWKDRGESVEQLFEGPVLTEEETERVRSLVTKTKKGKLLPAIKATNTKGATLQTIQKSVELLTSEHSAGEEMAFKDLYERQKALEERAVESAIEQWRIEYEHMSQRGIKPIDRTASALLWEWQNKLAKLIREEVQRIDINDTDNIPARNAERRVYGPFLKLLPPEKIAATTLLELVKLQGSGGISEGVRAVTAVAQIANALELEHHSKVLERRREEQFQGSKKHMEEIFRDSRRLQKALRDLKQKQREESQLRGVQYSLNESLEDWPLQARAKVGALLVSMVIRCATLTVSRPSPDVAGEEITMEQPAFFHSYAYIKGKKVGILKSHSEFTKLFSLGENKTPPMSARYLPMVAPPRPWINWDDGGYYSTYTVAMRMNNSREQKMYLKAATERGDLDTVFKGLDVLGSTQWMVHKKVFDTFVEVWNSGEALADIPEAREDYVLPAPPGNDALPDERARWYRDVKQIYRERSNNHSQRCDLNLKLEVARAFLHEKFYFPHNIDFRGRAYPIPPHFNHMGSDLCRGLLLFGVGKELGESGLRWMKIHLANVFGYDKASLSDREKFTEDHMEDIKDSASNPLGGKRWWLKGDAPWQTLSACIILSEAYELPDPTKYICHAFVAQDGSCNGLQHYAALGGDEWGAKQVNLEPSDKPADIYSAVCDIVNDIIVKDAEDNVAQAVLLKGHVNRKVVKQTVMTYVYGVTYIGAKAQIEARLKDIDEFAKLTPTERNSLASYLTVKILTTVQKMFFGATELQKWLTECALRIAKSVPAPEEAPPENLDDLQTKKPMMTSVIWTTPLGLPVVQPYRKLTMKIVETNIQKLTLYDPDILEQVNAKKQSSAFPPNFIHSLDATHMLLSALKCQELGLDFAAVHDSFWTHPSDVDQMNRVLRDAFISLHTKPITENLRKEFVTRYKGHFVKFAMPGNCKAAEAIRNWRTKTFGKVTFHQEYELLLENIRLNNLNSNDPERVAKAKEIKTAYSIFCEMEPKAAELWEHGTAKESLTALSEAEANTASEAASEGAEEGLAEEAEEKPKPKRQARSATKKVVETATSKMESEIAKDEARLKREFSPTDKLSVGGVTFTESTDAEDSPEDALAEDALPEALPEAELTGVGQEVEVDAGGKKAQKGRGKKVDGNTRKDLTEIWFPLTFPPVPEKGNFDISKLKDSLYFFS